MIGFQNLRVRWLDWRTARAQQRAWEGQQGVGGVGAMGG